MEFFLFSYKILTAYLFGYAVFFLFSLFYKNNKLKSFVDFSESKIPSVGLLILFIYLIVIFVEVYEDIGFLGGLKQYRYGFFGDKLFSSFFVYQFLSFAFLILPTQLFRFDKVNKSIFLKLFLILFFLLELNWILEEIESYLNLSGSRVYCSNFYSPYRIVKILIVYIVLNFILIKFSTEMLSRNSKLILTKIFSFFSVARGYNVFVIALAQYLSAIFILAPERRALDIILDWRLFLLVMASTFAIASGYIINNFYDAKKDIINRPKKSYLDRLVSQKTQLQVYFTLNFFSAVFGFIVSWRAALFFSVYIFSIWLYSHKLKKILFIGNITASLLAVLPFFGILLYFKNFYQVIFAHATFLFLIILIREMIKDLENIEGDLSNNYQTIPVNFGENFAKKIISFLLLSTIVPVYFLINVFDVGYMDSYFYSSYILLLIFVLKLWKSEGKVDYIKLHFLLKIILLAGVICIVLIKPDVIENGQKLLLIR